MEKEKKIKTNIATIFIILELILIIGMGIIIAKFYNLTITSNKNIIELNQQIETLKSENTEVKNETELNSDSTSNINNYSFSKLMDMMYPKSFENNSIKYENTYINDSTYMVSSDLNDNLDISTSSVSIFNNSNEITVRLCDSKSSQDTTVTITGIDEEIVSLQMITFEAETTPSYIYFLSREGNVYYTKNLKSAEAITDLKATKIENISNVVSINTMEVLDDSLYEAYTTVVGTLYDGSYEILSNYIK